MGQDGSGPEFHVNFGSAGRVTLVVNRFGRIKKIGPTSNSGPSTKYSFSLIKIRRNHSNFARISQGTLIDGMQLYYQNSKCSRFLGP